MELPNLPGLTVITLSLELATSSIREIHCIYGCFERL